MGAVARLHAPYDQSPTPVRPGVPSLGLLLGAMEGGALTRREVEVAESLLWGHSRKAIAQRFGISDGTVANHQRHIYGKLAIHSRAELCSLVLMQVFDVRPA